MRSPIKLLPYPLLLIYRIWYYSPVVTLAGMAALMCIHPDKISLIFAAVAALASIFIFFSFRKAERKLDEIPLTTKRFLAMTGVAVAVVAHWLGAQPLVELITHSPTRDRFGLIEIFLPLWPRMFRTALLANNHLIAPEASTDSNSQLGCLE